MVKNPPANAGDLRDMSVENTRVWSLGQDDPLKEGMATHSSILAGRIPWTEEPGGLWSIGSQTVGHNWSDLAQYRIDPPNNSSYPCSTHSVPGITIPPLKKCIEIRITKFTVSAIFRCTIQWLLIIVTVWPSPLSNPELFHHPKQKHCPLQSMTSALQPLDITSLLLASVFLPVLDISCE